jgi:hypothetical protein
MIRNFLTAAAYKAKPLVRDYEPEACMLLGLGAAGLAGPEWLTLFGGYLTYKTFQAREAFRARPVRTKLVAIMLSSWTTFGPPALTIPQSPFSVVIGKVQADNRRIEAAQSDIIDKIMHGTAGEVTGYGSATYTEPSFWTWHWASKEIGATAILVEQPVTGPTGTTFVARYVDSKTGENLLRRPIFYTVRNATAPDADN